MSNASRHEHPSTTSRLYLFVFVATLTGCGTFQLASSVVPLTSKSQEQQQLDNLACKDRAKLEANSAERQAGAFALGLTIVGAPVAYELEKAKQRDVYKTCMEARGYRVLPASDAQASPAINSASTASPAIPARSKLVINLPGGWQRKSLTDQMIANGVIAFSINQTTDSGVILSTIRRDAITDLEVFAATRRADQESRLTDPMKTDLVKGSIGGHRSIHTAVTGSFRDIKLTYSLTIIEGKTEIAIITAWTTAANFEKQRDALEGLSKVVTGL